MNLKVAKITNKLGFKNLTKKILVHKFGIAQGRTSKYGLQAFSKMFNKNVKIVTVLDKDLCIFSQLKQKKEQGKIIKSICIFYNQFGEIVQKRVMEVTQKNICHEIYDMKKGDLAKWNFHKETGGINIINKGKTGLIDKIVKQAQEQYERFQQPKPF